MLNAQKQTEMCTEEQATSEKKPAKIPRLNQVRAMFKCVDGRLWGTKGRVMDALILRADRKTRRLTELMSKRDLAEHLGCSSATVHKAIRELLDRKWLICVRREGGPGAGLLNVYEIWCDIRPGEPFPCPPNGRRRQVKPRKKPQQ